MLSGHEIVSIHLNPPFHFTSKLKLLNIFTKVQVIESLKRSHRFSFLLLNCEGFRAACLRIQCQILDIVHRELPVIVSKKNKELVDIVQVITIFYFLFS